MEDDAQTGSAAQDSMNEEQGIHLIEVDAEAEADIAYDRLHLADDIFEDLMSQYREATNRVIDLSREVEDLDKERQRLMTSPDAQTVLSEPHFQIYNPGSLGQRTLLEAARAARISLPELPMSVGDMALARVDADGIMPIGTPAELVQVIYRWMNDHIKCLYQYFRRLLFRWQIFVAPNPRIREAAVASFAQRMSEIEQRIIDVSNRLRRIARLALKADIPLFDLASAASDNPGMEHQSRVQEPPSPEGLRVPADLLPPLPPIPPPVSAKIRGVDRVAELSRRSALPLGGFVTAADVRSMLRDTVLTQRVGDTTATFLRACTLLPVTHRGSILRHSIEATDTHHAKGAKLPLIPANQAEIQHAMQELCAQFGADTKPEHLVHEAARVTSVVNQRLDAISPLRLPDEHTADGEMFLSASFPLGDIFGVRGLRVTPIDLSLADLPTRLCLCLHDGVLEGKTTQFEEEEMGRSPDGSQLTLSEPALPVIAAHLDPSVRQQLEIHASPEYIEYLDHLACTPFLALDMHDDASNVLNERSARISLGLDPNALPDAALADGAAAAQAADSFTYSELCFVRHTFLRVDAALQVEDTLGEAESLPKPGLVLVRDHTRAVATALAAHHEVGDPTQFAALLEIRVTRARQLRLQIRSLLNFFSMTRRNLQIYLFAPSGPSGEEHTGLVSATPVQTLIHPDAAEQERILRSRIGFFLRGAGNEAPDLSRLANIDPVLFRDAREMTNEEDAAHACLDVDPVKAYVQILQDGKQVRETAQLTGAHFTGGRTHSQLYPWELHSAEDASDRVVRVLDSHGRPVFYSETVAALADLERQILLIATHFIQAAEIRAGTFSGEQELGAPVTSQIDRSAVLLELLEQEHWYAAAKRQAVNALWEIFEHTLDPSRQLQTARRILALIDRRPIIELPMVTRHGTHVKVSGPESFRPSYAAEIAYMEQLAELLQSAASVALAEERNITVNQVAQFEARLKREKGSLVSLLGAPFPAPLHGTPNIRMSPQGSAIALTDVFPGVAALGELPDVIEAITTELLETHAPVTGDALIADVVRHNHVSVTQLRQTMRCAVLASLIGVHKRTLKRQALLDPSGPLGQLLRLKGDPDLYDESALAQGTHSLLRVLYPEALRNAASIDYAVRAAIIEEKNDGGIAARNEVARDSARQIDGLDSVSRMLEDEFAAAQEQERSGEEPLRIAQAARLDMLTNQIAQRNADPDARRADMREAAFLSHTVKSNATEHAHAVRLTVISNRLEWAGFPIDALPRPIQIVVLAYNIAVLQHRLAQRHAELSILETVYSAQGRLLGIAVPRTRFPPLPWSQNATSEEFSDDAVGDSDGGFAGSGVTQVRGRRVQDILAMSARGVAPLSAITPAALEIAVYGLQSRIFDSDHATVEGISAMLATSVEMWASEIVSGAESEVQSGTMATYEGACGLNDLRWAVALQSVAATHMLAVVRANCGLVDTVRRCEILCERRVGRLGARTFITRDDDSYDSSLDTDDDEDDLDSAPMHEALVATLQQEERDEDAYARAGDDHVETARSAAARQRPEFRRFRAQLLERMRPLFCSYAANVAGVRSAISAHFRDHSHMHVYAGTDGGAGESAKLALLPRYLTAISCEARRAFSVAQGQQVARQLPRLLFGLVGPGAHYPQTKYGDALSTQQAEAHRGMMESMGLIGSLMGDERELRRIQQQRSADKLPPLTAPAPFALSPTYDIVSGRLVPAFNEEVPGDSETPVADQLIGLPNDACAADICAAYTPLDDAAAALGTVGKVPVLTELGEVAPFVVPSELDVAALLPHLEAESAATLVETYAVFLSLLYDVLALLSYDTRLSCPLRAPEMPWFPSPLVSRRSTEYLEQLHVLAQALISAVCEQSGDQTAPPQLLRLVWLLMTLRDQYALRLYVAAVRMDEQLRMDPLRKGMSQGLDEEREALSCLLAALSVDGPMGSCAGSLFSALHGLGTAAEAATLPIAWLRRLVIPLPRTTPSTVTARACQDALCRLKQGASIKYKEADGDAAILQDEADYLRVQAAQETAGAGPLTARQQAVRRSVMAADDGVDAIRATVHGALRDIDVPPRGAMAFASPEISAHSQLLAEDVPVYVRYAQLMWELGHLRQTVTPVPAFTETVIVLGCPYYVCVAGGAVQAASTTFSWLNHSARLSLPQCAELRSLLVEGDTALVADRSAIPHELLAGQGQPVQMAAVQFYHSVAESERLIATIADAVDAVDTTALMRALTDFTHQAPRAALDRAVARACEAIGDLVNLECHEHSPQSRDAGRALAARLVYTQLVLRPVLEPIARRRIGHSHRQRAFARRLQETFGVLDETAVQHVAEAEALSREQADLEQRRDELTERFSGAEGLITGVFPLPTRGRASIEVRAGILVLARLYMEADERRLRETLQRGRVLLQEDRLAAAQEAATSPCASNDTILGRLDRTAILQAFVRDLLGRSLRQRIAHRDEPAGEGLASVKADLMGGSDITGAEIPGITEAPTQEDKAAVTLTEEHLGACIDRLAQALWSYDDAAQLMRSHTYHALLVASDRLACTAAESYTRLRSAVELERDCYDTDTEAQLTHRHYDLLSELDRRAQQLLQAKMAMATGTALAKREARAEYSDLVGALAAQLGSAKTQFAQYQDRVRSSLREDIVTLRNQGMLEFVRGDDVPESLRTFVEQTTAAEAEAQALRVTNQGLRDALAQLEADRAHEESAAVAAATQQIAELRTQLEETRERLALVAQGAAQKELLLRQRLVAVEAKFSREFSLNESLRRDLDVVDTDRKSLVRWRSELQASLDEANAEVMRLRKLARVDVEQLQGDLTEHKGLVAELQLQVDQNTSEREALIVRAEQEIHELVQQLDDERSAKQAALTHIKELEARVQSLELDAQEAGAEQSQLFSTLRVRRSPLLAPGSQVDDGVDWKQRYLQLAASLRAAGQPIPEAPRSARISPKSRQSSAGPVRTSSARSTTVFSFQPSDRPPEPPMTGVSAQRVGPSFGRPPSGVSRPQLGNSADK